MVSRWCHGDTEIVAKNGNVWPISTMSQRLGKGRCQNWQRNALIKGLGCLPLSKMTTNVILGYATPIALSKMTTTGGGVLSFSATILSAPHFVVEIGNGRPFAIVVVVNFDHADAFAIVVHGPDAGGKPDWDVPMRQPDLVFHGAGVFRRRAVGNTFTKMRKQITFLA